MSDRHLFSSSHPDVSSYFYSFAATFMHWVYRIFWRTKIYGRENVPPVGPAIIAANHRSYADPPLVGSSLKRPVHFLAKKELFDFKPLGWLISNLNSHPLNRAIGVGALKEAQHLLENGCLVVLFPEGRRSKTNDFGPPKGGVGMLAITMKCPIIPTYIHNSGHMIKFKPMSIRFAKPLDPAQFNDYQSLAEAVMGKIQAIKDENI